MKKRLSSCNDCGDDISILTQVRSCTKVILLKNDYYNLKYTKKKKREINYNEKEKS